VSKSEKRSNRERAVALMEVTAHLPGRVRLVFDFDVRLRLFVGVRT
jgi:hypothetical protein